jgi:hypothetical protein
VASSSWDHILAQPLVDNSDPFGVWCAGGSHQTETSQTLVRQSFAAETQDGDWDDDTSDTLSEELPDSGISKMNEAEASAQLLWSYRRARRNWRRFTGKLVRKFRRVIKCFLQ